MKVGTEVLGDVGLGSRKSRCPWSGKKVGTESLSHIWRQGGGIDRLIGFKKFNLTFLNFSRTKRCGF